MDPFSAISLTLGIVCMFVFFLSAFPYNLGNAFFALIISGTGIGLLFGLYAYFSYRKSIHGLIGAVLSLFALILASILWLFFHQVISVY